MSETRTPYITGDNDAVITIPKSLYDDIVLSLEETLERPFECDCEAYQEFDTGAWIHQEEKCWAFMEDHIGITLDKLKQLIGVTERTAK